MSSLFRSNQTIDYPLYLFDIQIANSDGTVVGGGGGYVGNNSLNATDLSSLLSTVKSWANTHDWTVEYGTGAHVSLFQIVEYTESDTDVTANY